MSTKKRIEAALAAKKNREVKKPAPKVRLIARPATGGTVPGENPLIPLARNLVNKTPEGKEALIALRAVRDWKSSEAIRRAHGSLSAYHDVLTELHAAGVIKFKGEDFLRTGTKKDGADYGLELHSMWIKAGKPGKFSDFLSIEEKTAAAKIIGGKTINCPRPVKKEKA